jgi:predicted thioesterase
VEASDTATFESGQVHPVYATFALARDAEWSCRLFVLEMKDELEEGIGTFITVQHLSPAIIGSTINFEATLKAITKNEICCTYVAKVGERIIATGETGQKIILKSRLEDLFLKLT